MSTSMTDLAVRVKQRQQRLEEEQKLDRVKYNKFFFRTKRNVNRRFYSIKKVSAYAQNPDAISEPSELESSRQPPKPKRRHRRSAAKGPFDDDNSLQFSYTDKKSISTTTTSSSTPRQPSKFVKKSTVPTSTEKLSVKNSPRDVSSPRMSTRHSSGQKFQKPTTKSSTGLLWQSSLLNRAAHRHELYNKGIELEPGTFDQTNDDDSSSDVTSTSGTKILFGSEKKSFLKKDAAVAPDKQIPDLQHLDSETNSSEREGKKTKNDKNQRPSSGTNKNKYYYHCYCL